MDGLFHMIEQELGRLEPFGQVLTERLLDDARSGEPDHRARLGDDGIAEHGVARAHAACRRIGEDRDVRDAALGQHREHGGDFRHLHEGKHALLHACATRRRNHDERELPLEFHSRGHDCGEFAPTRSPQPCGKEPVAVCGFRRRAVDEKSRNCCGDGPVRTVA